ncbi:hypothetical protein DQ04_06601030, partial [Trypanosoma grayi]|uniref:hypothetical protein n=1 Tax=Trypanosoma grayi TaxID=71804 RepID=UPI0004F43679
MAKTEDAEAMWMAAQLEANMHLDGVDDVDEELLRDVPCANDALPPQEGVTMGMPLGTTFSAVAGASASTWDGPSGVAALQATKTTTNAPEAATKGVCAFPPLSQMSFMLRGDNGVVRWLTASGLEERRASRKRGREAGEGANEPECDMEKAEEEEEEFTLSVARDLRRMRSGGGGGLGYVNVPALLQELYEEASTTAAAILSSGLQQERQQQQQQQQKRQQQEGDTLWVIKYSPKRFRDLLSDDAINLKLLQWMKSWDAYIFQDTSSASGTAPAAAAAAASLRPDDRLAVLVGPPGVGKTTLAHVLAVHCGYEPIEINASVDRAASRMENAIQLALAPARGRRRAVPSASSALAADGGAAAAAREEEGTSLVDMLLRPKCLIIDEMDGIAANVATFLLQQDIHCPVLCLCNDYYVPSLRPLRRQCQHVYHFPPIRPQRLLSRLSEITEREGLAVSQAVLADLVQSSNGDVRCCLNTLQFLYRHVSQSAEAVGALQLIREMHGKDSTLGLWETWRTVLERKERGRYIQLLRKEYGMDYEAAVMAGSKNASAANGAGIVRASGQHEKELQQHQQGRVTLGFRVDPGHVYVSRVVQQCADTSTLLDGLQEYYLQRPYADYSLRRTRDMADAFSFQDHLSTCAHRHAASAALIPFAEQYAHTTAAACFSRCST